ncbi:Group II intron-encoded protein LtrA [Gemmata obscuriglobus]|uniref:RNA-directed DNA polymerase n=2 Tax=Gemmata obscuriglobus TaxID=114 RepID=A0A2Z3HA30_9BACT|nr:group II intron reverse transcriptase/maturase [Gemmata obscuriglobus]AWM37970.1 group II intron reverse transcriptase/maturase [Gemmata obscuriglobus]AWM40125.1 group II intron reverse transcriptase/maturase [Gemmata obscuriglobus]QEG26702.1 Group II intron-encoded protein LtrA [Gemmata obscuriglobus]QEG29170.1 Group II intron-encoded protein LtrA [Gemmata obscuriglobus]VTS02395.1 Retron-type reverse transcriptase OS=Singulisphaera acidiphila (strain ATCC BAA-1392 / DSM 18658 / VKM B-2454 
MGVKRPQGRPDQRTLFEGSEADRRHDTTGEGGTGAGVVEESQASAALEPSRALTDRLMEEVCQRGNLNQAYSRVKANKGAPGIDGMTVEDSLRWIAEHKQELLSSLLDGSYRPSPVRGVLIPKPGGGERQLGIPTVVDRLVQQAILQVLTRLLDPTFSESSYGFRPGKSAHQALLKAKEYVADGRAIVVDVDLEKFFDRVNHDILMARLARRVSDTRLLRIVRRFLEAGLMQDGVCVARHEGTPQGGPLSPLLANLLLDDLDQELERRGHTFCRYADDCNIYVRSEAAGRRVMASVVTFLEAKLKLRVNREKSAVARVEERKFLGYRLLSDGRLGIAPASLERAKDRIRAITRRNRGIGLERMVRELNSFLTGWVTYFRHAAMKNHLTELDGWVRRKLRCVRLKQCKRVKPMVDFFARQGVSLRQAWCTALSGKGWWRKSGTPVANQAMPSSWWETLGLVNLVGRYEKLQTR